MKDIIENFKKRRNEIILGKIFDILEDMEDWQIDSLKNCCEVELDERHRRKGNTIECLNVQNNY